MALSVIQLEVTMEYMTMAQTDQPINDWDTAWVPGIDFDPYDDDDMEIMQLVWERDKHSRLQNLERANQQLRERLSELTGEWD